MKDYVAVLSSLPRDAVVMAGGQTIAVKYWRGVGAGQWEAIGTGGGWPGEHLFEVINSYLREGKRVMLDTDPRLWSPCGWQKQETQELPRLQSYFRFRRITESVYEIRPTADQSAQDSPRLERLLPENRSGEIEKCLKAE